MYKFFFVLIAVTIVTVLTTEDAFAITIKPGTTLTDSQTAYVSNTTFNASSTQVQPSHIYLGLRYYDINTTSGKVVANVTNFSEDHNMTIHIINSSLTNVNMTTLGQAYQVKIDGTFYPINTRWSYVLGNTATLINIQSGRDVFVNFVSPLNSTDPRLDSSGEQRVSYFDGVKNWIFYYDPSSGNLVYRSSPDNGITWSSPDSTNSGTLAANSYYGVFGSGSAVIITWANSTKVLTKAGILNDATNTISWNQAVKVGSLSGTNSGQNYLPSFSGLPNKFFLGFNVVNGTVNKGYVYLSTNSGSSWTLSTTLHTSQANPAPVGLALLAGVKEIAIVPKYDASEFVYEIYNGTTWGNATSTTGAGLTINTSKVHSFSITNDATCAWIGYVPSDSGGILSSMQFCDTGYHFLSTFIPTGNTYPTISSTGGVIHLYYIQNNMINDIVRFPSDWSDETQPFGTVLINGCCLHAQKISTSTGQIPIIFRQGSSQPYNVNFVLSERFASPAVPSYSNAVGSPFSVPPGGCHTDNLQCDSGDLSTGKILLYGSPPSSSEDDQYVEFNKNPLPGNSPSIFFNTSHTVQWGTISDSVGTITQTVYPFAGEMLIGVKVYKCPATSSGCSSSYQFDQFIGTTITAVLGSQSVNQTFIDVSAPIPQIANYNYTGSGYGATAANAGKDGGGVVDFGNPNISGDPYYMKMREIYALWP